MYSVRYLIIFNAHIHIIIIMSEEHHLRNYHLAKEHQELFSKAIKCCMESRLSDLQELLKDFLRRDPSHRAEDLFIGFESEGRTLLHIAASSGHYQIYQFLVDHCPSVRGFVNAADHKGFTPLINATIGESNDIVSSLIKLGADVNWRNNDGAGAIHFAASDGDVPRLKLLCDAGADIDCISSSGTALHWAASKARSDAVKFLIERNADINKLSREGIPAVLVGSVASCDMGVSYLVDAGADVGAIVAGNLTALHICAENGLVNAVESIVRTEAGRKCCLIETADGGNTPLQLAAMSGSADIVRLLLPYSDTSSYMRREVHGPDEIDDLIGLILKDGKERLLDWERTHSQLPLSEQKGTRDEQNMAPQHVENGRPTSDAVAAAELWKEKGNALYRSRDFQAAVNAYSEALLLNKFDATYWSNRSLCYLGLDRPDEALSDAEMCRLLKPDWSRAHYRVAAARLALHRFEDAAVAAFEGLKLDQDNRELKTLLQTAVRRGQEEHKSKDRSNQSG